MVPEAPLGSLLGWRAEESEYPVQLVCLCVPEPLGEASGTNNFGGSEPQTEQPRSRHGESNADNEEEKCRLWQDSATHQEEQNSRADWKVSAYRMGE